MGCGSEKATTVSTNIISKAKILDNSLDNFTRFTSWCMKYKDLFMRTKSRLRKKPILVWVKNLCEKISDIVIKSFTKSGIINVMYGTEDDIRFV